MFDLQSFSLREMTACGVALRGLGKGAASMEEVSGRVVRFLFEHLRSGADGAAACVLVRLFVTVPYAQLEPDLQRFARDVLGREPESPAMRCLTLLGTAGARPEWNARATSLAHKALPLVSEASIGRSPMIAQLIGQLGVETASLLAADPHFVLDAHQHTFNVFHVLDAVGSPHIPAQQEFVIPFGVRSVIGFGGLLPTGDLFATIVFTKHQVPRQTADLFKALALNVKVALVPFAGQRIFA
ncbi:MAG: hypothetical protein ABJD07_10385 [Gemmatimonadaceae bacterium]